MKHVLFRDHAIDFAWDNVMRPSGVCVNTSLNHVGLSEHNRLAIIASAEGDPVSLAMAHKQAFYVTACDAEGDLAEEALQSFTKGNVRSGLTEQDRLAMHMQQCDVSTAAQAEAKTLFEEKIRV